MKKDIKITRLHEIKGEIPKEISLPKIKHEEKKEEKDAHIDFLKTDYKSAIKENQDAESIIQDLVQEVRYTSGYSGFTWVDEKGRSGYSGYSWIRPGEGKGYFENSGFSGSWSIANNHGSSGYSGFSGHSRNSFFEKSANKKGLSLLQKTLVGATIVVAAPLMAHYVMKKRRGR